MSQIQPVANVISFPHSQKAIAVWVKEFEEDYFIRRAQNPKSETTWEIDYQRVFRKLPGNQPLTPDVLIALATSTPADSRTRRRYCLALAALARFAGLTCDLKRYRGSYTHKKATQRHLPSDAVIASWFEQIDSPAWRWAYGMLATYGLRNHELFQLDYQRLRQGDIALKVLDGKTGPRLVFPFYPEWVERFNLTTVMVPEISGKANKDLGHRVSQAFRRFRVPFRPYDLRHCWAVRTLEFSLETSLAAQQMGHSLAVHTDLYHAWITERRQRQMFEVVVQRGDRPRAPL